MGLLDIFGGLLGNQQQAPNNLDWIQPYIQSGEVAPLTNQQWAQQMQQIDANQPLLTQLQNAFSGNWSKPSNPMATANQGAQQTNGMPDANAETLRQKLVMQALGSGQQPQQQEPMPQQPTLAPAMPSRFGQQQQAPNFSPMSLSSMPSMQQQALAQPMMLNQAAMQRRKFLGG
jgi:hypothetical protein